MNLHRYYSARLMPLRLGKPPKLLSPRHLEYIRSLPCACTGQVNPDAHHVLRKSQGENDYATLPLAHHVHMELHQQGEAHVETKYGVDLKEALIAKLIERIIELEGELEHCQPRRTTHRTA